jgi:hypothetical protein
MSSRVSAGVGYPPVRATIGHRDEDAADAPDRRLRGLELSGDGGGPGRLADAIAAGTLDADLGALLWILVEARIPLIVSGGPEAGRAAILAACVEALPAGTRVVSLEGEREDFAWMPEAVELGWRRESGADPAQAARRATAGTTVMVADLDEGPGGTWGGRARVAIRALAVGYGMLATARGDRLEDVLGLLAAAPVEAIDDELTRLGVVLTIGDPGTGPRITAAHYMRPVVRDANGHVQRRPPAVLATWDPRTDTFEHFAWGVTDELAGRVGLRPTELEREQARRATILAHRRVTRSSPALS